MIPERWRLGDTISFKIRRVANIECDRLTVCCPVSWRFLYPTATDFFDVSEDLDGWGERSVICELKCRFPSAEFLKMNWSHPAKDDFTVQVPEKEVPSSDVIVVPRRKPGSSPHRDWESWKDLTDELRFRNLTVLAAGRKDMSFDCGVQSIENIEEIAAAMLKTRFVVSTDSGLAHLAILLRVPLILLWGTPVGVIPGQSYKQGCHARMESQKKAQIHHIEGAWNDFYVALNETLRIIMA